MCAALYASTNRFDAKLRYHRLIVPTGELLRARTGGKSKG
jgi:hypothetical protein